MERTGRLIRKLAGSLVSPEEIVRAVWAEAAGEKIARHTVVRSVAEGVLLVEVGDAVWRSQLETLEPQVRQRLDQIAGPGLVRKIRFQVAAPRRRPARALEPVPNAARDEADSIADPVLRRVYRMARRKASA